MGWKESAEPVLGRMPGINRPEGHVAFKRKLTWTAGVLIVYFFLTNIFLWGLPAGEAGEDIFGGFRSILAGEQGTIMQVGIGPIVTASIVMQLLGGADLLGLDTSDPRDQILYQGLQKLLVIIMTALTAYPMVFMGFLQADPAIANALGISPYALQWVLFIQILIGGIIILFLDEVVSKWGIGSGIGLFIIAGVSQRILGGIFSWPGLGERGVIIDWFDLIVGRIDRASLLSAEGMQQLFLGEGHLLAIITTLFIFGIVVYAESVRVEIPLSHSRVRGARGRFPVKLIYASVLPMILVRALQMNIQLIGRVLNSQWADMPASLGVYDGDGNPVSGFFYYTSPIMQPQDWMWWLAEGPGQAIWMIMLRISIDLTFMIIGGAIFAIFWVETTNMGPDATAQQIQRSGMQIPGFRQNVGVYEKVLARYIPQVTVLGGALVGLLAVMANMLGTIGGVTGEGLLLTVSITYKLYEEIAEEQMMEMHPMVRQMFGRE